MKQIKILSLGDEAVRTSHNYLPKISKCDDLEIVAGTVFRQGATLESHIDAIKSSAENYCFVYNNEGSVRFNTVEVCSVNRAADWFKWDYIIIQQNINTAGDSASYTPYIAELEKMIKMLCPSASIVLSAPYAENSYIACLDAVKNSNIDIILPVAEASTAAMNAGVQLVNADGTVNGRENDFLTAGVWYEALTGNNITANSYRLPFVTGDMTVIMKNAVHNAVVSMKKRCFNGR